MPNQSRKQNNQPDRRVSPSHAFVIGRFGIIFAIVAVIAMAIVFMLVRTTLIHADDWNRMAESTFGNGKKIQPERGEILASDGSILATNLYYANIMVDFRATRFMTDRLVDTIPQLADSLAKYFPKYDKLGWEKRLSNEIAKPKKKRTRNFVIAKAVPEEMVAKVKTFPFFCLSDNGNKTGLKTEMVMRRSYPFGEMARLSIGRVGQTADDSEVHGRSGLERALDTLLYGVPGQAYKEVTNRGTRYVEAQPAINGYHVTTTIDITMQDILEEELGNMLLQSRADWGTAVLMEVATGDIKAISNLERDSTSATPRYIEAYNRAVMAYEPGSVMKVMTMAVALEKGYANPNRAYSIGREFAYLGRKPIRDTHSPGSLTVSQFLEYSSNIGMTKMMVPHYEHNPAQFKHDLAELGFFERFNTGIAGERKPFFPTLPNNVGGRLDLSRQVYGYNTMIPPLYTCAFYNAVANDGKFARPRLVKGLRGPDGRDSIIPVSYVRERMMSPANARTLRKMMHGVVWEKGGTAKSLKSDIVEIAGKTGTCKVALEDHRPRYDKNGKKLNLPPFKGGYLDGHYRMTFCGFFPFENPKYTCVVCISDPKGAFRGPAVSAGVVLKNTALKLHARGMLNADPTMETTAFSTEAPKVYASLNPELQGSIRKELGMRTAQELTKRSRGKVPHHVPDVLGVSLREALATLEAAGYHVDFDGVGYVYQQTPGPGTRAPRGTKVTLNLRYQ